MNFVIDIGNTLTKLFVAKSNEIIYNEQLTTEENYKMVQVLEKFPSIKNLIISSVVDKKLEFNRRIVKKLKNIIYLDETTPLPIKNYYKTPKTLGKDRIAAIVGAHNIFPRENVLAIDAGTAITYDFVNQKGEYNGGNISPGMSMRFRALNQLTSKLPLLSSKDEVIFFGTNTSEAIIAGVQNGIIFEMDTYIDKLREMHHQVKVILTGGDGFFFAGKLKNPIFAKPFLVALGLNRILEYNVKKQ